MSDKEGYEEFEFPDEKDLARSLLMTLPIPHVPGYVKGT